MIDDIAIVGIGLKIADCTSIQEYDWKLQKQEPLCQSLVGKRLTDLQHYMDKLHKVLPETQGEKPCYLKEIDLFDYKTFHISPKEAVYMDPNQRLMLDTVYSAFMDSGIPINEGSNTAVYIGYRENKDYLRLVETYDPDMLSFAVPGNLPAAIAGRISYTFDWKGNCMLMDAGDSSSLLALQSACNAIRSKEAKIAVAGGIDLNVLPFDKEHNGECVIALVLKSLTDAKEAKDPIYGIIKSCVSNRSSGSEVTQKEKVISDCVVSIKGYEKMLSLVELSGTSSLQDREALKRILGDQLDTASDETCMDILTEDIQGLDISSGLMGVVKVLLFKTNGEDMLPFNEKEELRLLAHFGRDGGNTCVMLEKTEECITPNQEQLVTKRKSALNAQRCWLN